MKLPEFRASDAVFRYRTIIVGLDFVWDLHNTGTFLGVGLDAENNTATMRWSFSDCHAAIKYSGCRLIFTGLKFLVVSARDEDLPLSEDLCVRSISKVIPG